MNALLDTQTIALDGDSIQLSLPVPAPTAKCFLEAGLSMARGGAFLNGPLSRTVVVVDSVVPALTLFTRDIKAQLPRGGRVWLVIRYAGQMLATGQLQLIVP